MPSNNGMDWIRFPKRMAIYHRDGFRCVWCLKQFETSGLGLTLDHIFHARDNHHQNLVTCCHRCNSQRQGTEPDRWILRLGAEKDQKAEDVALRLVLQVSRPLDLAAGRALAEARRASLRVATPAQKAEELVQELTRPIDLAIGTAIAEAWRDSREPEEPAATLPEG
jgi:hypothetical protein